MKRGFNIATLFLFSIVCARATSYEEPKKHRVYSPDKEHFILVDPESKNHSIRSTNIPWLKIWSFSHDFQFDSLYLANDGKAAFWVAWRFVQEDGFQKAAIVIFNDHGETVRISYADASKPRKYRYREVGPIGDFWRIWRNDIEQNEEGIIVQPEGKPKIQLHPSTKAIQG